MAVKEIRRIGSFVAKEANGTKHTIYIYQDFIDAGTRENRHAVVPGLKSLKTAGGEHVNKCDDGGYEILSGFGEIALTSDDPNAP